MAKFATKVLTTKRIKVGENDSEAKTGSGTAFREAAKKGYRKMANMLSAMYG